MAGALAWREVPAGPFRLGSDPAAAHLPDDEEPPRHTASLRPARLARTALTNAQYGAFVAATGRPRESVGPGADDLRARYVTLPEARAFCARARLRPPSEVEWEAAARGGDDRLRPWGDEPPDPSRALFAGVGYPGAVA